MQVGRERRDTQRALSVHHIAPAVVVDEQTGVVEIFGEYRALPGTLRTVGLADGEVAILRAPAVGGAEGDVKLAVVVADGRGPSAVEIERAALHVVAWVFVVAGDGIAFGLPVDKVAR